MSASTENANTLEMLRALGHEAEPVLKAVRRKCLDCAGGSPAEVAGCLVKTCALFPFRMGRNPWRVKVSDAQREASRRIRSTVKITRVGKTDRKAV